MGYVGLSRSVRSQESIENFEMPLSMISRGVIDSFFKENNYNTDCFTKIPVYIWKFVCKKIGKSSWHHTSKYYNETNHYSLYDALEYIKSVGIEKIISEYKSTIAKQTKPIEYEPEVVFAEWVEFRGKNRNLQIHHYEEFGVLYKNWIHITPNLKKKADGKNLSYRSVKQGAMNTNLYQSILFKLKIITTAPKKHCIATINSIEDNEEVRRYELKKQEQEQKELIKKQMQEKKELARKNKISKQIQKEIEEKADTSSIKITNIYKKIIKLKGYDNFNRTDMPSNVFESKQLFKELEYNSKKTSIYNEILNIEGFENLKLSEIPVDIDECISFKRLCEQTISLDEIFENLVKMGYYDLKKSTLGTKLEANSMYEELTSKMHTWKSRKTLNTIISLQKQLEDYGIMRTLAEMKTNTSCTRTEIFKLAKNQ